MKNLSKQIKKIFYLISLITLISCGINKKVVVKSDVNTKPDTEYKKSRKAFSGKLNDSEYKELISLIESELKTTIPEGKSVLINYNQKAQNCISLSLNDKDISTVIKNRVLISSRISSNNNTINFFVYANDSYHKDIYQERDNFILDSGFFYDNVFTEHENCEAFLIIKPNGNFLKYYGEDYYSEVSEFLENNKN